MKVSGSWSIQNFLDIDENFDFGIFPFRQTGDANLFSTKYVLYEECDNRTFRCC